MASRCKHADIVAFLSLPPEDIKAVAQQSLATRLKTAPTQPAAGANAWVAPASSVQIQRSSQRLSPRASTSLSAQTPSAVSGPSLTVSTGDDAAQKNALALANVLQRMDSGTKVCGRIQ
jgi:hypothetical protein